MTTLLIIEYVMNTVPPVGFTSWEATLLHVCSSAQPTPLCGSVFFRYWLSFPYVSRYARMTHYLTHTRYTLIPSANSSRAYKTHIFPPRCAPHGNIASFVSFLLFPALDIINLTVPGTEEPFVSPTTLCVHDLCVNSTDEACPHIKSSNITSLNISRTTYYTS